MVVKELTGQLMAGIRTFRLSSAQCPCQASGSCPVGMLIVGSPLLKCLVGPSQEEDLHMGYFCPSARRKEHSCKTTGTKLFTHQPPQ